MKVREEFIRQHRHHVVLVGISIIQLMMLLVGIPLVGFIAIFISFGISWILAQFLIFEDDVSNVGPRILVAIPIMMPALIVLAIIVYKQEDHDFFEHTYWKIYFKYMLGHKMYMVEECDKNIKGAECISLSYDSYTHYAMVTFDKSTYAYMLLKYGKAESR